MNKDRSALLTLAALTGLAGTGPGGTLALHNEMRQASPDWIKAEYYTRRDPSRNRPPFNKTQENARRVRQAEALERKRAR